MGWTLHKSFVAGALAAALAAAIGIATPAHAGAVAFAKESTDLGSSDSVWYYAADPCDLGPFDTPSGLVPDNGKTSAAAAAPCPPDIICTVPALLPDSQGEATASADLATGTLRVYAFADGRALVPGFDFYAPLVESEAFAGYRDTITALADGVLHFFLHIDGTDTYDPRDGGTADYIDFLINGAYAQTIDGQSLASNDGVASFGCGSSDSSLTPCSVDLRVDVPVITGEALDISLLLGVVAGDGTADYSHTLSLRASGVSFTSESGVFLSDVGGVSTVPEPPMLAMFGFGALGVLARRRQKADSSRREG